MRAEELQKPRDHTSTGFTLIEVLVVLIILGLAIAILVTRGPARSLTFDLRASAGDIAQILRVARSQAIATDRRTIFELDASRRSYGINGETGPRMPADIVMAMTATSGELKPQAQIAFLPDGSSSGGRVVLGVGTHRMQIVVDWLTGSVTVSNAP